MFFSSKALKIPTREEALPGRDAPIPTAERHAVNGNPIKGPYPDGHELATFGMGCFWGPERVFWQLPGVHVTAVGYSGGHTQNPTYREVCTGMTGHNEVVRIVFDPALLSFEELLKVFWEGHDPTQGMRQGNDVGTQYRSAIYYHDEGQKVAAERSRDVYQKALAAHRLAAITTEIAPAGPLYFAESDHQQYLAKNPMGYCGMGGTGVACPVGTGIAAG